MDAQLYVLGLAVFGVLYLVLSVFLVFALLLSLLALYLFLVLRYGKLPDDYPYGTADTMVTTMFLGVTWGVFMLLGPKNPVPFIGSSFTYSTTVLPVGGILTISIVVLLVFLVVGAVVIPRMSDRGGTGGRGGSGGQQGQQTVGAG
jgi:hypothetical protein